MKLMAVDRLPERRRPWKSLKNILDEFVNMNVKFAKYDFSTNDYKHAQSAYGNLRRAAITFGYPVKVCVRNGDVYFERTDM